MGETTGIGWTDHTWNPWMGCQRVSPGCEHCYAETLVTGRMRLPVWGPPSTTTRKRTSVATWKNPATWHRAALKAGVRRRLFVASLADVFEDHPDVAPWRAEALAILAQCTALDVQLLTKRPQNVLRMVPPAWLKAWPRHVWIGTTVEDQRRADERIPELLKIPAAVRFLSCEPLLGPLTIGLRGVIPAKIARGYAPVSSRIDWAIVGGESGPGARPCHAQWVHNLVREFADAEVPIFVKQAGAYVVDRNDVGFEAETVDPPDPESWPTPVRVEEDLSGYRDGYQGAPVRVHLKDPKGGDPQEWPDGLRVRQFPEALS